MCEQDYSEDSYDPNRNLNAIEIWKQGFINFLAFKTCRIQSQKVG